MIPVHRYTERLETCTAHLPVPLLDKPKALYVADFTWMMGAPGQLFKCPDGGDKLGVIFLKAVIKTARPCWIWLIASPTLQEVAVGLFPAGGHAPYPWQFVGRPTLPGRKKMSPCGGCVRTQVVRTRRGGKFSSTTLGGKFETVATKRRKSRVHRVVVEHILNCYVIIIKEHAISPVVRSHLWQGFETRADNCKMV